MKRHQVFRWGGAISGGILIAFGVVVIVLSLNGHRTVTNELKQQQITGTPDMTPEAIQAEGEKAGLKDVSYPSCSVAGEKINTGSEARCFAQYMNIHALEATGGYVYSEMGIYTAKPGTPKSELLPGGGTNNTDHAVTDPKTGQPVQNAARNIWVTETALSTALNTSYMATQLSLFSLVVGIALILSGIGFIVLAFGATTPSASTV
ncbi:MAG TPA: hypothetical protein VLK36_01700 [Gaiellaceae bacterium]|nr:hypothetical protein [Gaiellaceae bacterium]